MERPTAIESATVLSYVERLKAEIAVASGSVATIFTLAFFPAGALLVLALPGTKSGLFDTTMLTVCFVFSPFVLLARAYRGYVAERKNGPFIYQLNSDGLFLKTRTAELKLTWQGIPRVRTRLGFLLVYCNRWSAYPLPLRTINPQLVQSVLEWAKAGGTPRVGT
jgi:hypothetical protein